MGHILLFFLGALALAAQGNGTQTTTAKPPPAKPVAATRPAPIGDIQLEKAIRDRFAKSKIHSENFTVSVKQGVATIAGKTDVIQRKGTATRLAKVAGARAVNNEIEVSEAARERAGQNLEKGRRRAQVKRSEVTGR